jgi:hypothetical protein
MICRASQLAGKAARPYAGSVCLSQEGILSSGGMKTIRPVITIITNRMIEIRKSRRKMNLVIGIKIR